jgi:hypothetical protein
VCFFAGEADLRRCVGFKTSESNAILLRPFGGHYRDRKSTLPDQEANFQRKDEEKGEFVEGFSHSLTKARRLADED